jgi:hypothetical protein
MKNLITIYVSGGLGNNLFQIAYAEYLRQLGYDIRFNTCLIKQNWFTKGLRWTIHKNEITEKLLKDENVSNKLSVSDLVFLICEFVKKKITKKNYYKIPKTVTKRYFGYAAIGNHLESRIINILSKKIECLFSDKIAKVKEDTVLHIRRGDFPLNCSLDDSYYKNAINMLGVVGTIKLVTDDPKVINYVKANINKNVKLSNANNMIDDFFYIFNAKNVIMSNSTYCYWACVLGNVQFVIHPSRINSRQNWILQLNDILSKEIKCKFLSEVDPN